ncbi:hypothetical protein ACTSKR_10390 [Chitinibacteraceae bacterium HSL-7]
MATKSDLVLLHLETLSKYRGLVASAYHHGAVDSSDDPAGGRGIDALRQAGILLPRSEGTYRLSSSLMRHLDETLQKERLYSSSGADLADLAQRLPDISNMVADAAYEGRSDDVDLYIDEFDIKVFEIADSVQGALLTLRFQCDNNFANVSTLAEKRKQNEFYLERATRISETLSAIHSGNLSHNLESLPEGSRMLEVYQSQIAKHLPEWRAQLLDITAILQAYLHKTRHIELVAKRMRAFELYLKRNPGYSPGELDDTAAIPEWAKRARPLPLRAHADVQNPEFDEDLLKIARSIPEVKLKEIPPPRLGSLLPDTALEPDEGVMAIQPWEMAILSLLNGLSTEPVSAVSWKANQTELAGIDDDIWLLCLLREQENDLERNADIRFEYVTEPTPHWCGNIPLSDIILSRIHA